jgi:hypothetical protein
LAAARVSWRGRGAGLGKEKEEKWRRTWGREAALLFPWTGGGCHGWRRLLFAPYPAAKPRSPRAYDVRPLHSSSVPNEVWNVEFAPDQRAKLWGNHRAFLLSHDVPRFAPHWQPAHGRRRPADQWP